MFDNYLLKYIFEFLKKCRNCNNFDIKNNGVICCICSDFYCNNCKDKNLVNHYGFCKSKYCLECSNYFFIS